MGKIRIGKLIITKGKKADGEYQGEWGDRPRDVLSAGNENEPTSDLSWGDFRNYGADSEAEKYPQSNEETQGY